MRGTSLKHLPELPITLVPELKGEALRRGLTWIVMKIFEPESEGLSTREMVDMGLERLADKVGVAEKSGLITKVDAAMDVLLRKHLKDYIKFEAGKYKPTKKFTGHYKSVSTISRAIMEWSGQEIRETLDPYLTYG